MKQPKTCLTIGEIIQIIYKHCITHYDTCDSFLFSNKHTHTHKHIHTYVFVMFTKHAKFGNIFVGLSLTTENLSIILLVLFRFYLGFPIPTDYLTVILLFYTDFSLTDFIQRIFRKRFDIFWWNLLIIIKLTQTFWILMTSFQSQKIVIFLIFRGLSCHLSFPSL